jgi:hypothetical protein
MEIETYPHIGYYSNPDWSPLAIFADGILVGRISPHSGGAPAWTVDIDSRTQTPILEGYRETFRDKDVAVQKAYEFIQRQVEHVPEAESNALDR